MYTGNQNRAREEKNLDALLQMTSDNPAVYIPKGPQRGNSNLMAEKNTNSSISELHTGSAYTPKGPPKGNPNLMAEKNRNFNINKLYTGSAFSTDNYLNLNNYSNLNKAGGYGGGMQDISAQRGPGGTGGGSEDTEGNMDANQLLELNPYLSKNVTSFNDGGMFGEFAKYNHGGTVGSVGPDGTNYSVGPYKSNKNFSPNYDGGAEENRINKIRSNEFLHQNKLNPYQLSPTSGSSNPYGDAFNRELKKRQNDSWLESLKDGSWGGTQDRIDLKNPWEEGYDNWYGQAKNGMRMPKYNHGGTVGSMGLGGESWRYEQNKLGSGNTYTASSRRYNPEVVRLEEKARRDQFMSQNNLPHGFSSSDERGNPYKTSFRAEQDRRQNERWLEAIKTNNPNSHNIPFESLKNPWEEGYDNWYGQAENGMRMPKYNDGGMMQQQQMPQQTESYAKQANDMIALAQLEAFGKKFLSQTQGQMPPEIAQAMNQQGMSIDPPMANKGMRMKRYTQGGRF